MANDKWKENETIDEAIERARQEGFDQGYVNGESSGYADWYMALTEFTGMPDGTMAPMEAVKYVRSLENA